MNFNHYQAEILDKCNKGHKYEDQLFFAALALAGEAGEVVDEIKKLYRDDDGKLTPSRLKKLILELGDCQCGLTMVVNNLGLTLEEIAQANLKKLKKRTKKRQGDVKR